MSWKGLEEQRLSDVQAIRQAIISAIPLTTSNHGETPERRYMYLPPAHIKALRLECNMVIGARGVGKSFWTAALRSPALRQPLGQAVRELEQTDVCIGFATTPDIAAYPDREVFSQLMQDGERPFDIWRSVIARWLAKVVGDNTSFGEWKDTVAWVRENPEPLAKLVQRANQHYAENQRFGLILFDALDRTSSDWKAMDDIVRDLLQVVLWLKSHPRLHAKVFLREDQSDRTITNFPDASKLLATKAELYWAAHDLHGLVWQMFCNAPAANGECLRDVYEKVVGAPPLGDTGGWQLADEVKRESAKQRQLFETLAGSSMGRDRRRGVPYVWSVSHLADGRGRTSPRSFLAAIRAAAEDSLETYPDHPLALHYESIKRGVQKASEIRVSEMAEDYPWVTRLMGPLHGLSVPCTFDGIEEKWNEIDLNAASGENLPPQHMVGGHQGLRNDLERLGIFETMKDGRVNLPDLYRVGFGLGRRGGVKPLI